MSEQPKWLLSSRERIKANQPFKVGSDIHLIEMATDAYSRAATECDHLREVNTGLLMALKEIAEQCRNRGPRDTYSTALAALAKAKAS